VGRPQRSGLLQRNGPEGIVMNKARRKQLDEFFKQIEDVKEKLAHVPALDDLHSDLETLKDEEQESFDNLPEGLQGGERGQAIEAAVGALDEALDSLQEAVDKLSELPDHLQNVLDKIMEAQDG
jgi:hypothetical protein